MPDVTATDLARGVRSSAYRAPQPGAPPPPAFLVMPTTVGRKSVKLHHEEGSAAARSYLRESFADWLGHSNPSMRGNAANTLSALDTYIAADNADDRQFVGFGEKVVLKLPSGTIRTRVDVIATRQQQLSARAVFWDGQTISLDEAHVIAYPYARALEVMYPDETISDICIWQVRKGTLHLVSFADALARANDADAVLARR